MMGHAVQDAKRYDVDLKHGTDTLLETEMEDGRYYRFPGADESDIYFGNIKLRR
jgi:hypothetical protein